MAGVYDGKTAVVSGASGAIGAEIAKELALRGGRVVLVARRYDRLVQLAAEMEANRGVAIPIQCDVTLSTSIDALVQTVKAECGSVDLLVNNAGKELLRPLQALKPEAAREVLEVNVIGTAQMSRGFLRLFKEGSAIVNMASAVGLVGAAGLSMYSASKGGVISLTRALAKELAVRRIRVNAVAPGIVNTEMWARMLERMNPAQAAQLEAAHPLGFGAPRDVALAVAFLGSDEAAWITGQVLVVDGGFTM